MHFQVEEVKADDEDIIKKGINTDEDRAGIGDEPRGGADNSDITV